MPLHRAFAPLALVFVLALAPSAAAQDAPRVASPDGGNPAGHSGDAARQASAPAAKDDDGSSAPVVVLAALGGLLLLLALLWGLVRLLGWDPRWLAGTRHATAEAGWRASTAWDDFRDWIRRGRASSAR